MRVRIRIWGEGGRVEVKLEGVVLSVLPQELGHLLGSDELNAKGRFRHGVSCESERRGDGVGGPVDDGVDTGEEGFAKDAIIIREVGDNHGGLVLVLRGQLDQGVREFSSGGVEGTISEAYAQS